MLRNPNKILQCWRDELFVADHISLTHLNEPSIFETRSGQVGSIVRFEGFSFETAGVDELNARKQLHQHLIGGLGVLFSVSYYTLRRHHSTELCGEFTQPFADQVNRQYSSQFKDQALYTNDLYVVILRKGPALAKKGLDLFKSTSEKLVKEARSAFRKQAVSALKKATVQYMELLSEAQPHLLGACDKTRGYSEVLAFFGYLVTGQWNVYQFYTGDQAEQRHDLQQAGHVQHCYPEGNLAAIIADRRLFFGKAIQLGEDRPRFGAMIAIKSYASKTHPLLLEKLLHVDSEMIISNHFLVEDNRVALTKIARIANKHHTAGSKAHSLVDDLDLCQDDMASERLIAGYHQNTIMVFDECPEGLEAKINQVIKVYSEVGFRVAHSVLATEPLFWSQIPGNQHMMTHLSMLTSENFVDFCPLFNYTNNIEHKNHLGAPVTIVRTRSHTPCAFNYHARGSGDKNDLTPGHTTLIGGNGSGKTVFMGFMDTQISRFNGRSFFFDRDRGTEIYVRAMGGRYFQITADAEYSGGVEFNPFQLPDTPNNRGFLKDWLGVLMKEAGEEELPADIAMAISQCVDFVYNDIEPASRSLATAALRLPMDFPRKHHVRKWLRGQQYTPDGPYAWLFDNVQDSLDLEATSKIGFDLTDLMSQSGLVLVATCMYLMYRIKLSLDGRLTSILFDEGWQVLDHPYWRNQLRQDLPTLRKLNAHIILSTQSPASVVNSSLSAQFLDNCATNIFFCNPMADWKYYQHFRLNYREFDFLKNTPKEQRLWLYKQGEQSVICQLPLGGMKDELAVWSANKFTLKFLDRIRQQVGDDPAVWMPLFHQERVKERA